MNATTKFLALMTICGSCAFAEESTPPAPEKKVDLQPVAPDKAEGAPDAKPDAKPEDKPAAEAAQPEAKPADEGAEAKDGWQLLKEWKALKFKEVLSKAKVDEATTEKIRESLKALEEEQKTEYQKLRDAFKHRALQALIDSGLSKEQAEEISKNYDEEVKAAAEHMKKAVEKFAKGEPEATCPLPSAPPSSPPAEQPAEAPSATPPAAEEPAAPASGEATAPAK